VLHELTDFSGNGHREVLWIVKLVPVALGGELGESDTQVVETIGSGRHLRAL
jgi:hypothetical protein